MDQPSMFYPQPLPSTFYHLLSIFIVSAKTHLEETKAALTQPTKGA